MEQSTSEKAIMTVAEAAEYLGLSQSALNKWRCYGMQYGPAYIKMGKSVRYRLEDLQEWIDENAVG